MSATPAPSAFGEMAFVPRDLVTIQVGRYSATVYPKVESSMPVYKRAHAFQVARTALEPLPVYTRLILDALGAQLNCSSIVDGLIFDWKNSFDEHWCNFANLTIQSFHNSAGAVINNTTIAADPTILMPVQNGAAATCRKPDVCFVRVTSSIDFAPLVTIAIAGPTVLRLQYYLELPQSTLTLLNGVGANYNLTTWHGAADLSSLSAQDVRLFILDVVLQDGPIALLQADFNLGEVNIDSNGLIERIHAKILKLGFNQIAHCIFSQLCPNYSDQPHAALDHIRQSGAGPDGQPVTSSVIEFYQRLMNASRPFQAQRTYPVSICDTFIQKLDRRLLPSFRRLYPAHATTHRLDATYQRQQLSIILYAAQAAEDEVHQVQDIARSLVGQGFFSMAYGGQQISAYPSQAETTLNQYAGGGGGGRKPSFCWGCGKDGHPWRRGKGPVVCPMKDDPACIKRAEDHYKKYLESRRARGGRNPRDKSDATADTSKRQFTEYKDMTDKQRTKMHKDVLAATTSPAPPPTHSSSTVGPAIFFMSSVVQVLSAPPARRILPVPVQAAFPHLTIQLGSTLGCNNCPAIRCIIDTAAALTTGTFHFFAQIAKAYPHTVAAIDSHADYSPIVLSGIVQQNGESVTTDLTVAFQFHMPYLTREGTPSTLLVATGPHVMVNAILGLPFIQQTCMIIDAADQVAELRSLDSPLFAIDFRRAMCTIPPLGEAPNASHFSDVIAEVGNLERYVSGTPMVPAPPALLFAKKQKLVDELDKRVSFAPNVQGQGVDISAISSGSVITIGGSLEPDYDVDASVCDDPDDDIPLSA